jgi:hypothetical protein
MWEKSGHQTTEKAAIQKASELAWDLLREGVDKPWKAMEENVKKPGQISNRKRRLLFLLRSARIVPFRVRNSIPRQRTVEL